MTSYLLYLNNQLCIQYHHVYESVHISTPNIYLEPNISKTELLILYALPKNMFLVQSYSSNRQHCRNSRCREGKKRREKKRMEQRRKGKKRRKVGRKEEGRKPKNHSKFLFSLTFHASSSAYPLGSNSKILSKIHNFSM